MAMPQTGLPNTATPETLEDSAPRLIDHPDQIDLEPIVALRKIMQRLRNKEQGCPWDVQQSFASIAPYTIEEAYEVADAISRQDFANLREELGDLLLQIIFHSQMASEAKLFDFNDVVRGINEKMIRRHPHVFAGLTVADADEQTRRWNALKRAEKANQASADASILDSVSRGLNEFERASKLQARAAEVGFDWPNIAMVLEKLDEESQELADALQNDGLDEIEEELGDLLFVAVNIARHAKVNPQTALLRCNLKFEQRFKHMEQLAKARGLDLAQMNLEAQDALWLEAKQVEKALQKTTKSAANVSAKNSEKPV
jgi:nucleoside triphosphate diphosphatase